MKTIRALIVVCSLLLALPALAQPPSTIWSGTFPGVWEINDAEVDQEGNVVILTDQRVLKLYRDYTNHASFFDLDCPSYFSYTDEPYYTKPMLAVGDNGELVILSPRYDGLYIWQNHPGGWTGSQLDGLLTTNFDFPVEVEYAGGGYYYVLSEAHGGDVNGNGFRVIRLMNYETIDWDVVAFEGNNARATDLIALPDGGCALAGYVNDHIWIGRLNSDGMLEWGMIGDATWPLFSHVGWDSQRSHLLHLDDGGFLYVNTYLVDWPPLGVAVVQLDSNGNFVRSWEYDLTDLGDNLWYGAAELHSDGSLLVTLRADQEEVYDSILLNFALDGALNWWRPIRSPQFYDQDIPTNLVLSPTLGLVGINRIYGISPFGAPERTLFASVLDLDTPRHGQLWLANPPSPAGPDGPVLISPDGETFNYDLELINDSGPAVRDIWVQVFDSEEQFAVELAQFSDITIPSGLHIFPSHQTVPAHVPPGYYDYALLIGQYPWQIDMQLRIKVRKLAGPDDGPDGPLSGEGWELTGEFFEQGASPSNGIPAEYALSSVYPNPFNPTASVEISLPIDGPLKVVVYDLTGRQVAQLTDGTVQSAGVHHLTFDGTRLASGVYFVRASVPGEFEQVRKAVLVR